MTGKTKDRSNADRDWKFANQAWWFNSAMSSIHMSPCVLQALFAHSWTGPRSKVDRANFIRALALTDLPPGDVRRCLFYNALMAKWRISDKETSEKRRNEALDGFLLRNAEAASFGSIPYPFGGWMKRILATWLPCVEAPLSPRDMGRFGPGACAEKLSHFRRFLHLREWVANGGNAWPEGPIATSCDSVVQHDCARLHAVPKDYARDRLITVEPMYGTFTQQYVRSLLLHSVHNGPLRGSALDQSWVDSPSIHRRLTLEASRKKDLATIDLSDASDRISWSAVKEVFPSWVVALLEVTRSNYVEDPRSRTTHPANIFAGMGNATTFVVETLFFASAVKALCIAHGLRDRRVTVFGDDIIASSDVVPLLEQLRPFIKVNEMKTFAGSDNIRESCGIFAYQGADVTYPDIRGYLPDWEGRLGVADLYTRLKLHYEGEFSALAEAIRAEDSLPCFPTYVPGYPCIWSGDVSMPKSVPQRINRDYQRLEIKLPLEEERKIFIPGDEAVARKLGFPRHTAEALYHANLSGMLTTDERGSTRGRVNGYSLPLRTRRTRMRWIETQPLPDLPSWPSEEGSLKGDSNLRVDA